MQLQTKVSHIFQDICRTNNARFCNVFIRGWRLEKDRPVYMNFQ